MFWFAVQVRQRYERCAAKSLTNKGVEVYLPLYVWRRQWWDRVKTSELPLFPGYVFARFDPLRSLPVLSSPGVIGIVGFGHAPAPVDEVELATVRTLVESGYPVQPWQYLRSGQRVRIGSGPLRGVEGIFTDFKNRGRLIVSVELLQRSVAVEIDAALIAPVQEPRVPVRHAGRMPDGASASHPGLRAASSGVRGRSL